MAPRKKKDRNISVIAQKMVEWQRRNGLSIRTAREVFEAHGYRIPAGTFRKWLSGERSPSATAAQALEAFLKEHAVIENPPVHRPGPKPRQGRPPPIPD